MEYKVINNFLDEEVFKQIQNTVLGNNDDPEKMSWFFNKFVAYRKDYLSEEIGNSYFTHTLYEFDYDDMSLYLSNYYGHILKPILQKLDIKSLIRAKINLYPRTKKLLHHGSHKDFKFPHKGFLLSLNTCDGFTEFEDKKIPSIENQALFFDSGESHNSTTCTNDYARYNININYF
tara:strand:+ start:175 stop:702 length:528 start_codon:yes stop_codon:yes gene_type:complete